MENNRQKARYAMNVSLIVPMYNEDSIICESARTLHAYLEQNIPDYELLFVDDGSTDDCAQLVAQLRLPHVRVLRYEHNRGKGCAVRKGMLAATGEIRMFIDADLAYGTQVIARALKQLQTHPEADLLIGSRALHPQGYEGYTALRRLASKVYLRVLCVVGGFRLSDSQCGCKAYRAKAAQEIFSRCETDGFAFDFETILWAQKLGYSITELPVKIVNHRASKVRLLRDTLRMLRELFAIKKRVRSKAVR